MKNIYNTSFFIIFYVILFFSFSGCPTDPPVEPPVDPPEIDLIASVEDSNVTLVWDIVEDISSFTVYRKEGTGVFNELETIAFSATSYMDSVCPVDVELCYKIVFTLDDNSTFDSNESNSVIVESVSNEYMTGDITASNMEFTDRIRISWDPVDGTDSYKVYRYISTEFIDPVIFDAATNQYDDINGSSSGYEVNTPYFYKVACVVDNEIYAQSSDYSVGIFSNNIDYYENNNTLDTAIEIGGGEVTSYIYSFHNGEIQDVDWYKSTVEGQRSIRITLPAGLSDEIQLLIQNTGSRYELTAGDNYVDYSGTDELYFKIEFIYFDFDIDVLEPYDFEISVL